MIPTNMLNREAVWEVRRQIDEGTFMPEDIRKVLDRFDTALDGVEQARTILDTAMQLKVGY